MHRKPNRKVTTNEVGRCSHETSSKCTLWGRSPGREPHRGQETAPTKSRYPMPVGDLLIAIFHPASRSGDRSFYNGGEGRPTPRRVVRRKRYRLLSNQGQVKRYATKTNGKAGHRCPAAACRASAARTPNPGSIRPHLQLSTVAWRSSSARQQIPATHERQMPQQPHTRL